jgi:hypothetical protein
MFTSVSSRPTYEAGSPQALRKTDTMKGRRRQRLHPAAEHPERCQARAWRWPGARPDRGHGLCHTDIHAAHGDWPIKPVLLIPGHEGVGRRSGTGFGDPQRRGSVVESPGLRESVSRPSDEEIWSAGLPQRMMSIGASRRRIARRGREVQVLQRLEREASGRAGGATSRWKLGCCQRRF